MKKGRAHILAVICAIVLTSVAPDSGAADPERDWKVELEEVCVKTDISMTLSREELHALVLRCDELEKRIAKEDEVVRRIYLRRLKRCRDLFVYVMESKTEDSSEGQGAATPQKPSEEEPIAQ
jgi:hypothetical protein